MKIDNMNSRNPVITEHGKVNGKFATKNYRWDGSDSVRFPEDQMEYWADSDDFCSSGVYYSEGKSIGKDEAMRMINNWRKLPSIFMEMEVDCEFSKGIDCEKPLSSYPDCQAWNCHRLLEAKADLMKEGLADNENK